MLRDGLPMLFARYEIRPWIVMDTDIRERRLPIRSLNSQKFRLLTSHSHEQDAHDTSSRFSFVLERADRVILLHARGVRSIDVDRRPEVCLPETLSALTILGLDYQYRLGWKGLACPRALKTHPHTGRMRADICLE